MRVLVLDACRSGALTRVKRGRIVQPFAITHDAGLRGEGMVLTASSANEDAQESDELRGSFFAHALVLARAIPSHRRISGRAVPKRTQTRQRGTRSTGAP